MDPEFDERFVERWGTAPSPNRAMPYYIFRYVLKDAIERAAASGEVTRESLQMALTEVSIESPIGLLDFDSHHQSYPNMSLAVMEGGEIVQEDILSTRSHRE